jgi:hypothetical protein
VDFDLLDQAIVDHLDGHTIDGHPRPAGLTDVPDGAGWQGEPGSSAFTPYLWVDPTDIDRDAVYLDRPHAVYDGEWVVKGVSTVPGQAKKLAGGAVARLNDETLTAPAGMAITRVRHITTRGPYPDRDTVPELYVAAATVAIRVQAV